MSEGKEAVRAADDVVTTSEVRRLEERVREPERLLGRKTLEVEILKAAPDLARAKKDLAVALAGAVRFPMKTIAAMLGVARSNLVERKDGARKAWAADPGGRYRACRRHQAPGRCATNLWLQADRRAPLSASGDPAQLPSMPSAPIF